MSYGRFHNKVCIYQNSPVVLHCKSVLQATTLLGLFMDKTPISGTGSQISHQGSLFYASFASVLNLHLVADATDFVPILAEYAPREPGIVGTVLSGILEQVATDRELRKKYIYQF